MNIPLNSPSVIALITFYALWLLLTVINQFDNKGDFLSSISALFIIPRWTFFAPQPGVHDFHLIYRTEDTEGEKSGFQEISLTNTHRDLSAAVWNHRKRVPKILFDLAMIMGSQVYEYRKNNYNTNLLKLSFHYLLLLHIVGTHCRDKAGRNVQFVIARTEGHIGTGEPEIVFASDFHHLNTH